MAYQSFGGEKGDSDSNAKLAAIKLPPDLTGKSVLDIGCNEGFFCKVALERGASRVLGVDISEALIEKARGRVPGAAFEKRSWWELPEEKFDVILFLSAIHYEKDQGRLLDYLYDHLKPDGLLILECGTILDWDAARWHLAQRHDNIFRYPSTKLLCDVMLKKYAARVVGGSVMQAGDPVPRFVIHANPKKPTILVVSGESMQGKSTLARTIANGGFPLLVVDGILHELFFNQAKLRSPLVGFIQENMKELDVFQLCNRMQDANKFQLLADHLLMLVSSDSDLTVVEGYPFVFPEMYEAFRRSAEAVGYRIGRLPLD